MIPSIYSYNGFAYNNDREYYKKHLNKKTIILLKFAKRFYSKFPIKLDLI